MRPGQAAPVFMNVRPTADLRTGGASMRPGQAAPVFDASVVRQFHLWGRFNEAGAGCPGILFLSEVLALKE